MKVLHVVPSVDPIYGGPSQVVPAITRALVTSGLEVDILTMQLNQNGEAQAGITSATNSFGVTTHSIPRSGRGSYAYSFMLARWLWHNTHRYDLLHLHTIFAFPTLAASRIARYKRRPYVISPHGMLEPWCLAYKSWKKQPYLRLIEQTTLAQSAALQALTAEEHGNLLALGISASAFILPNGINIKEFDVLPARSEFESVFPQVRGKKILFFMGRIDPKKGLDLLVKAMAQLLRQHSAKDFCLVIAGPDLIGHKSQIERLINDESLSAQVIWTGMLTGRLKLAALNAADVFVLPSRSEGFSVAVLEAMAARCPVVITEATNFSEVSSERAGFVIDTDVEQLSDALTKLLNDESLRRTMGENGHQLVSKLYDWSAIASALKDVYDGVVTRQQSPTS